MIDVFSELNNINILIKQSKFDEAEKRLNNLKKEYSAKKVKIQIGLLNKNINEKRKIHKINSSALYDKSKECYKSGKLNEYYGDYYIAYQDYMAGYYFTDDLSFIFHAGVCQYVLDNQEEAEELFLRYINEGGYKYLAQSYFFLADLKYIFNTADRKIFHKKIIDTNNYMKQFNDNINFRKLEREEPFYYSYTLKF